MVAEKAGAWRLLGQTVGTGWAVVAPLGWDGVNGKAADHYNGTGGNFSVTYIVEKNGKRAFLKAIDFTSAMEAPDVVRELQHIVEAHSFETRILGICQGERMDRIVVALESGQVRVGPNLQDSAPFLIFELADGDVRRRIQKLDGEFRTAWWLRALHHTTVGLNQLHGKRIAHQDLKPSNVLCFGGETDFKISDLGRSVHEGSPGPYDTYIFAGDWGYAPPEVLYQQVNEDRTARCLSADLYLLGSMIFFFGMGFGCTQLLMSRTSQDMLPFVLRGGWAGTYRQIFPHVQTIFTETLYDLGTRLDPSVSQELVKAASELCNPDPALRGHPLERAAGNKFGLARYVSLFDILAKRAEVAARRA
jgi:eukaryotic-like serine/threonine-protein kinase